VSGRLIQLARDASQGHDPELGLRSVAALRRELEIVEAAHVDHGIEDGWSWSMVAAALGVTKQAVHKRHAKRIAAKRVAPATAAPPAPARRVIPGATRRAVHHAREEAIARGDAAVGTAHLLLGILREGTSPAARALTGLGVELGAARGAIEDTIVQPRRRKRAPASAMARRRPEAPISPVAREALSRAMRAAVDHDGGELSPEHLLAAAVSDEEGGAARTLTNLGVPPAAVRARLEQEQHASRRALPV
jgi:hypothetical protein